MSLLGDLRHTVGHIAGRAGYRIERVVARDLDPNAVEIIRKVQPYTLTTPDRIAAVCAATEHIVAHGVPGDVVECGVWRGGSMMAVAHTLRRLDATDRRLHLFDTFSGMTEPGEADVDLGGRHAAGRWRERRRGEVNLWAYASLEDVRAAMASTGYPPAHITYVQGKVEDTLPDAAPERVALLRLDTDWYASTRHEMRHLYPRLSPGGVLIVDDYGHWRGARQAVDEYLAEIDEPVFLARVDYTGRIAIRPHRA